MPASDLLQETPAEAVETTVQSGATAPPAPETQVDETPDLGGTDDVASVLGENDEPEGDNSGIDDELAELASSYDLNPASFRDRAHLENVIAVLDRQASQWAQRGQQTPQGQQPASKEEQQAALDFKRLLKEAFGDEEYDPAVEKLFTNYHQQAIAPLVQHLPAIAQRLQQFEQFMQSQHEREATADMDRLFTGLGDEWSETFGKGDISALRQTSPHFKARQALAEEMVALDYADSQRGRPQSSRAQLFQRALNALHGNTIAKQERKKLTNQLGRRNGAALAKPSSKTGKPASGYGRAVAIQHEIDRRITGE